MVQGGIVNTKLFSQIDIVRPPQPDWDAIVAKLSESFEDKDFYLDNNRHELRIDHRIAIQPSWATDKGEFCYKDSQGQGWSFSEAVAGNDEICVAISGNIIPVFRLGWLVPYNTNDYAWNTYPVCMRTFEVLTIYLKILFPMVESFWELIIDNGGWPPKSDNMVVGLLWTDY